MSSMKRKRNVLTIETKLEIINQLENGVSGSSLVVRYNIGKATVSDIKFHVYCMLFDYPNN